LNANLEDTVGMAALEAVPKFRNPTANKTPDVIMRSLAIIRRNEESRDRLGEAEKTSEIVEVFRGQNIRRRFKETQPAPWACRIPAYFGSRVWVFGRESRGLLEKVSV